MAVDNIAIVRRSIEEVWNKGMMEVADELAGKDQVFHDALLGDVRGLDGFKQHVRGFRTAFPDLTFTIEDIAAAGDKVYFRFVVTGTHKGSFLGLPPTNKRARVTGMAINRLQAGKFVEVWTSYDALGLLQQLGMAPALEKLRPTSGVGAQPH